MDLIASGMKVENLYMGIGETVTMDNRKIGDIVGNKFGDNVNLQGDYVTQTKIVNNGEQEKAYENLVKDIHELKDELQKEQALFIAEQVKVALDENNKEKATRPLALLRGVLGDVASIASIASIFGITLG
ncbi:hypothetical protein COL27_20690 [Bacillus sp. AFS075960]|nr:hypothetical protein COL27_20690 [Bacillus sp. AFS075960]